MTSSARYSQMHMTHFKHGTGCRANMGMVTHFSDCHLLLYMWSFYPDSHLLSAVIIKHIHLNSHKGAKHIFIMTLSSQTGSLVKVQGVSHIAWTSVYLCIPKETYIITCTAGWNKTSFIGALDMKAQILPKEMWDDKVVTDFVWAKTDWKTEFHQSCRMNFCLDTSHLGVFTDLATGNSFLPLVKRKPTKNCSSIRCCIQLYCHCKLLQIKIVFTFRDCFSLENKFICCKIPFSKAPLLFFLIYFSNNTILRIH